MYIKPMGCPKCGKVGRAHDFQISNPGCQVHCSCGSTFTVENLADQLALSDHFVWRIQAFANELQFGKVSVTPGDTFQIDFHPPIEIISKINFTAEGNFLHAKEITTTQNGMIVICAKVPGAEYHGPVNLHWFVWGLSNIDQIPYWKLQFVSGFTNNENRMYSAALFDYAVAFEAFVENYLRDNLKVRYDEKLSDYLLKSNQKIENRVKELMSLASSSPLTKDNQVYDAWDKNVRQIRNKLFHGKAIDVTKAMAEKAHYATYDAIRYIQDGLPG